MKPITPVIPGKETPVTVYGEGQPQYQPLPALRCDDEARTVVSRWRLTFAERIRVALTGDIWLSLMTFGKPIQPSLLSVTVPVKMEGE